jgi:hypothetical protein
VETRSTGAFSQSKETKMFKNRFLLVLGVLSLLLVATAVSLPLSNATKTNANDLSDYAERHPELIVPAEIPVNEMSDYFQRHNTRGFEVPVTGLSAFPDYFQRHPELSAPAGAGIAGDMTDYFLRHSELRMPKASTDLSDYFLRH